MVTLLWSDWIELVVDIDPDRGGGAVEWIIAGTLLAAALALGAAARRQRRRRLASV
jgi:hypothetical protein